MRLTVAGPNLMISISCVQTLAGDWETAREKPDNFPLPTSVVFLTMSVTPLVLASAR